MKTRFIVNPRSGRATQALPAVRAFASTHGADVVLTERRAHAGELAAQAVTEGCGLVVAVGGDGTMNEVASRLIGSDAVLGLVPCGSGDGLGRHLKIHGPEAHALAILETGRPQLIDTALADGHPFFTVAGLGFEAEISRRFNLLENRGLQGYITTSAAAFHTWQPEDYTIEHEGKREHVRAFTVAVANSDQYGNEARVAPDARVDDGLLDLCAVPPITLWNAMPLFVRLFHGSLPQANGAFMRRAARFVIERAEPGIIHTDGEVREAGRRVEFVVRPASLRVMCPC